MASIVKPIEIPKKIPGISRELSPGSESRAIIEVGRNMKEA